MRRPLPWFAAALLSGAFALGACGKEQSGPALDAGSDGGGGSAPAIRVDFAEGSSVASQVGFLNSLNVFEVLDPSVVPEVLQRLQEDPALGVRRAIEDALDPERLRVDEGALSVLETLAPGLWKAGGRTLVPACLSLRHAELDTVVHVELYDWWIQVDQAGRVLAKDPLQDPDTWQQWASRVREAAEQVAAARCEPAVYNVWGEPDNFWDNDATPLVYDPDDPTGPPRNFDRDHFYQLFADTEELLEQVHSELGLPPPRMAGPNTAAYREDWLQGLLDVVVARGAHLDVVSWHELGRESEFPNVVEHVADATRRIRAAGLPVPPVHVSETLNGVYTFAPGAILAMLASLEAAGVAAAGRACWAVGTENFCYDDTFDGLFGPGGVPDRPLPGYWVYSYYARGVDGRVRSSSQDPRLVALASRSADGPGSALVLVGYYGAIPSTRESYLDDHPPLDVPVELSHLDAIDGVPAAPERLVVETAVVDFDPSLLAGGIPEPAADLSFRREVLPFSSETTVTLTGLAVQQVAVLRLQVE